MTTIDFKINFLFLVYMVWSLFPQFFGQDNILEYLAKYISGTSSTVLK